jgi:hypothetical protein
VELGASASPFQGQGKKEAVDFRKLAALQEFTLFKLAGQ